MHNLLMPGKLRAIDCTAVFLPRRNILERLWEVLGSIGGTLIASPTPPAVPPVGVLEAHMRSLEALYPPCGYNVIDAAGTQDRFSALPVREASEPRGRLSIGDAESRITTRRLSAGGAL